MKNRLLSSRSRTVWTFVSFVSFAAIGVTIADAPRSAEKSGGTVSKAVQAEGIATRLIGPNFHPSLEMREMTDFILTPALLVQESISSNVIVTIPAN